MIITNKATARLLVSATLVAIWIGSVNARAAPDERRSAAAARRVLSYSAAPSAANNLSFPVIFSDNTAPNNFPQDGPWRFAPINDPESACVGESGLRVGKRLSPDVPCYYGRHTSVDPTSGAMRFDGPIELWWLQKRGVNFWEAFSIGHDTATPLAVSAVDMDDRLESARTVGRHRIPIDIALLQSIEPDDPEFGSYVVKDWSGPLPPPCTVPLVAGESVGCFAAVAMSGAVPGMSSATRALQGTSFGPGSGPRPGARAFVDPTRVYPAVDEAGNAIPIHAVVYSACARLVIQRIKGRPAWDPSKGYWSGRDVGRPVIDVAAYDGTYPVEINAAGTLVYRYTWNARTAALGRYRITFVLDGNDATGPQCSTTLATVFDPQVTEMVNVGGANPARIVFAADPGLGDEGGLVYIDLVLVPNPTPAPTGGRWR